MKKVFLIFALATVMVSCTKTVNTQPSVSADSVNVIDTVVVDTVTVDSIIE